MGKLEGIFIIAAALLLLWIGITGRGEALMAAIGIVRKAPGTAAPNVKLSIPEVQGPPLGVSPESGSYYREMYIG